MKLLNDEISIERLVQAAALGLLFVLAGCASTGTQSSKAPSAPATAVPAAASEPAAATAIPAPSGDMGNVVFFRARKFTGSGVSFKVREGEQELGKLSNGSYFVTQVPTGSHAFVVHSEVKDILNIEVERGETYYVQGAISMGLVVGRPNLSPSDAATFDGVKDKLKNSAGSRK